jgi:hypothetical protein
LTAYGHFHLICFNRGAIQIPHVQAFDYEKEIAQNLRFNEYSGEIADRRKRVGLRACIMHLVSGAEILCPNRNAYLDAPHAIACGHAIVITIGEARFLFKVGCRHTPSCIV